ncbi:MAG: GntR family transcriptional regulator [Alphaproteobacteria bacterium]|nr:GntR family transcriptional regulator [Alphaproteobacteria bacterium]MCW5739656.1 GntR family transcriptional regulator [Alphaproteobacteria bacterium]
MLPRGRPPAVPASAVLDEVRHLIARAAGEPCPTLGDMAQAVGVNIDTVRLAIRMLQDADELVIWGSNARGGFKVRLMGVMVGDRWRWTSWSRPRFKRGAMGRILPRAGEVERSPARDYLAAVTAAGRF